MRWRHQALLYPLLIPLTTCAALTVTRPNIILIMTDDQDVELGSLNFMPKLSKYIGEAGARYSNGYVTTPMCCPSRSSMLTGLYVHNHHVFTNNDNCSSTAWVRTHEQRTFATYLQSSGYKTSYFGKYLNKYSGRHIPAGWSQWMGLVRNSRYYNYTLNNNGVMEHHGDNYTRDYLPDLITNRTLELIDDMTHSSKPFMAVMAYPAPHGPEDSAPQFQDKFQDKFLGTTAHQTPAYDMAPNPDKQWILRHTERMLPIHKRFTDALMTKRLQTLQSVDAGIQRIVERLSATGQLDNTYIFFTSDHGYHLGQFGLVKGKAFPYEFDTHVPFFVSGPGIQANSEKSQPVLNIDLAPTFLDIAGIDIPEHMDGKSILGTFKNSNETIRDAFLIERGKMSFKRYASVSNKESSPLTKRQKYLNRKMARECKKDKYQYPCLQNQNWVCQKTSSGEFKIRACASKMKRACYCGPAPGSMRNVIRKARSIASPRYEDLKTLGAIVVNLAAQINDQERKKQESWLSSKSLIKTQIQKLRAQLNELKQIRKYLRMRRPAGLTPSYRKSQDENRVGVVQPRNLFEETLTRMDRKCECSNLVKRSARRREDKQMARLHRLLRKEKKRRPRSKSRSRAKVSKKQDHCSADVRMNCFSHDNSHWKTEPLWNDGNFCACTNSNNNTYWCVRNINSTQNYLYCEYVTGMITYSNLDKDPHQLRNLLYTLSDNEISYMHNQLSEMKDFSGQEESGFSLAKSFNTKLGRRRSKRIGRG